MSIEYWVRFEDVIELPSLMRPMPGVGADVPDAEAEPSDVTPKAAARPATRMTAAWAVRCVYLRLIIWTPCSVRAMAVASDDSSAVGRAAAASDPPFE
jgi:hypothetical protein